MRRQLDSILLLVALASVSGCLETKRPLSYLGDAAIADYKLVATEIAEPIDCSPIEIVSPLEPRRLREPRRDELWDMSLAEAIHTALAHANFVRDDSLFLARQNTLVRNPAAAASVYDPAEQQTAFGFNRGVEAALSDFDTRFTTQMLWGRSEQVQNNAVIAGGIPPGRELVEQTGDFDASLTKRTGQGGTLTLQHNWDYSWNNRPNQLFDSSYRGFVGTSYRQPLWAGAGTEFSRIAGPYQGDSQLNVDQGVVVARINEDISLADFEADVRDLLRDVEEVYWNLSLSYHAYDSEVVARNAAYGTWQKLKANLTADRIGAAEEAQARNAYYAARARTENSLADLYESETRLRRLLGLTVNDGRVIRPADSPITAEVELDWQTSLVTALVQRVEIRRQKFAIRSLDLQLRAARSLTNPRLDFVSEYRVNGFGDRLLFQDDDDGATEQGFRNAYETITQGDQTGWTLGFELSVPIGQRRAHSRVRNTEIRLVKARAALSAIELEIGHELAIAFQRLDRALVTAKSNYGAWRAAEEQRLALEAVKNRDSRTIDLLLRAQTSVAQAKTAYFTSLVRYNQALAELHYRAGTLLAHNRVHLMEGDWGCEAYDLAIRRAVARSHGWDASKLLDTVPEPFATPHTPLLRTSAIAPLDVPPFTEDEGPHIPLLPPPAPSVRPDSDADPDIAPPLPLDDRRAVPEASRDSEWPFSTADRDESIHWERPARPPTLARPKPIPPLDPGPIRSLPTPRTEQHPTEASVPVPPSPQIVPDRQPRDAQPASPPAGHATLTVRPK